MKSVSCGYHRYDWSKGAGGDHTGEAAGTGNTALVKPVTEYQLRKAVSRLLQNKEKERMV